MGTGVYSRRETDTARLARLPTYLPDQRETLKDMANILMAMMSSMQRA